MAATLDDVLRAISKLDARVARVEGDMATKKDLERGQAEMTDRFDALDEKVELVRGILENTRRDSRDLRDDVDALHKGLLRAVPKDLPSQVRAKGGKPRRRAAGR